MCDDGGYLFCSFLKDSSWEFVWASSFILVEIFQFPFVPISRGGMLEYNEGSITGMVISLVNTEVNWLLRVFALSRSFVIGLSSTLRVGMPMFSRLFALMNDENRFGFVFSLSLIWLFTYDLWEVANALVVCLLSSLNCSQCLFNPVCFAFLCFLFRLLCILINSSDIHGRWVFALVLPCGMVLVISVVRLSRKKVKFVLTSCEFGSVSKYLSVSLEISFLSFLQSADLYLTL